MTADRNESSFGHPQGQMVDGAWQQKLPRNFSLKLPISVATADAAVLYTIPEGQRVLITQTFWEVTTGFSGGSSSAIGLSASTSGHTTKGDLLGGSGGDLTATLGTAGVKSGTVGADFGSSGKIVLEAGDDIRFDRVVSLYTAGAGFAHVVGQVID